MMITKMLNLDVNSIKNNNFVVQELWFGGNILPALVDYTTKEIFSAPLGPGQTTIRGCCSMRECGPNSHVVQRHSAVNSQRAATELPVY